MIKHLPIIGLIILMVLPRLQSRTDYFQDHMSYESQVNSSAGQRHCDMDVCDSVVTKCTHNRRCSCDFKSEPHCAKDCLDCLEEKFGKCCACVNLCPPLQEDPRHSSHVGDIADPESYEELFEVLTESDDVHGRWSVDNSPSRKKFHHPEHGSVEMSNDNNNQLVLSHPDGKRHYYEYDPIGTRSTSEELKEKCVVAFINRQLDMSQCRRYCRSMGASSYRWFHEGCCECVGKYCIHYGIDKPRCQIGF